MRLHAVVLNWNDAPATVECVRALDGWPSSPPTVWVVDNASTDGGVGLAAVAGPRTTVIRCETNRGFGGGNNVGIQRALAAGADAILLLNNDATIGASSVERLARDLQDHADLGIVGPRLRELGGGGARISVGGRDPARHVVSHLFERPGRASGDDRAPQPVDYVPGTAVVIRADVFRAIGFLDERYFFAGELADLCRRARTRDYISGIDVATLAEHRLERSAALRPHLYAYYALRNRFLLVRKFHQAERRRLVAFWTSYGLARWTGHVLRGRRRPARAIRLALADGLAGRFGGQNGRVLGTASASGAPGPPGP
jgi:GT2 family glycosyltransferase